MTIGEKIGGIKLPFVAKQEPEHDFEPRSQHAVDQCVDQALVEILFVKELPEIIEPDESCALEVPACQAEEQRGDRGGQKQHAEDDGGRQVEPVGIGGRGRTQARRVRLFRGGGSDAGYSVLPSKTNPAQVDAGFLILAEAAPFTSPAGRAAAPAS